LVIPKEAREALGIDEGTILTMEVADDAIVIRPLKPRRIRMSERIQEIVGEVKKEELELEG
jgi:AbrB family looped-hinge helix DNA binding protein